MVSRNRREQHCSVGDSQSYLSRCDWNAVLDPVLRLRKGKTAKWPRGYQRRLAEHPIEQKIQVKYQGLSHGRSSKWRRGRCR